MDSINDIISSLTPDDIKALKDTAESIFGSGQSANDTPPPPPHSEKPPVGGFDLGKLNPEMFSHLGRIMSAMNSDGGNRCRLIEALKPNLSPQRQKKADDAMQILKLLEILPLINELNNSKPR